MPRFYAYKVPSWELVDGDLPLTAPSVTRALSTPKALDATLDHRYAHLVDSDGDALIREWGTAIVAEHAGRIDVFIVDGAPSDGDQQELSLTAGGVVSYAKDQPWLAANTEVADTLRDMHQSLSPRTLASGQVAGGIGWVHRDRSISGIEVDPLNMVRAIFSLLTTAPRSDLRLTVDTTTTPKSAWIGEEERDVEFTTGDGEEVAFTTGPYRLSWHETDDLGKELDDLAEETPFEWMEESKWDGDAPTTLLRLGYPTLDVTHKKELLFEIGHNVTDVSPVGWTDHYDVVLVLGQGEGASRVRSHQSEATDRLRRVHVEADTSIRSSSRAREKAGKLLDAAVSTPHIDQITVTDTDAAPFGSFDVGDVITVRGDIGWVNLADDYRIVSLTHDFEPDTQTLQLEVWNA